MEQSQNNEVVSIVVETALDEAILVGTPKAFRKLSDFLLECASAVEASPESKSKMPYGVECIGNKSVPCGLFDTLAEVVPGALLIVKSDRDRYNVCVHVGGGLHS